MTEQGSSWLKWDLHVHSPASDGFSGTWEQFESQLKNAECDVIGINDYFSIAGYKHIKEKLDNNTLDIGNKTILPVVEFRMQETLQHKNTTTNAATHFNFHIVFDNSVNPDDIENFIKSLDCNGTKISSDYNDKKKLKEKKVYLNDVLDQLEKDTKFKNNYLLWLPYDEYGGIEPIDPESDKWIKESFIKKAHILGSAKQSTIDFFLWKSPKNKKTGLSKFTQEQFRSWFNSKKPCIKGSDSHSHQYPLGKLKDHNSNPINKFCWIKAEPTFEGLRQIIYEPETRICISPEKPKQPINTIDSITFKISPNAKVGEDNFCFAGENETYKLSPYFNCLIGGRGSGKSTILNFLGLFSKNPEYSNTFWYGNNKDNEGLAPNGFNPENDFAFSGTEFFEFLAQSQIEAFAKDEVKFTQAIYDRANSYAGYALQQHEKGIAVLQEELDKIINACTSIKALKKEKSLKEKEKRTLEDSKAILEDPSFLDTINKIKKITFELKEIRGQEESVSKLRQSLLDVSKTNTLLRIYQGEKTAYETAFTGALQK